MARKRRRSERTKPQIEFEHVASTPIWDQRAEIGLATPTWEDKCDIWERLSIPQAGITSKTGGYHPFRVADWAHKHPALSILVAGGIRASKSLGMAAEVTAWSPFSDLIWLAADTYDLTRQEFEYTAEALLSLGWTTPALIQLPHNRYFPCVCETVWGTLIETRSLHDVNSFVARAPDFIGLCEPGLADPRSVVKARERLSTRRGRLWMAGTFEEARYNWMETYWRKWARWPNPESGKSFTVPTWLNHVVYPKGKLDPAILHLKASYPTFDEFLLRCCGVPVPHMSQVIGDAWNPRVNIVPLEFTRWDDNLALVPVELAVDPGYSGGSHYVVLAIQVVGQQIHVIDELSLENTEYSEVMAQARANDWWTNVSGGTCDPWAGSQRPFAGPSPVALWWDEAGVHLRLPARLPVETTAAILRDALRERDDKTRAPMLLIDPKCERLIWEMTNWRRVRGGDGFGPPSRHNCDATKALGYWLSERRTRQAGAARGKVATGPKVKEFRVGG